MLRFNPLAFDFFDKKVERVGKGQKRDRQRETETNRQRQIERCADLAGVHAKGVRARDQSFGLVCLLSVHCNRVR